MRKSVLVALIVVWGACGDDESGAAPGAERGPCLEDGTCNPGLLCLSDLCVRPPDDADVPDAPEAPDADLADAGPDAAPPDPMTFFADQVAPILAAKCDGCHATGQNGAPAFGTTYASVVAYSGAAGKLADCTLTQSLLFTRAAHAGATMPTIGEYKVLRTWLELQAASVAGCAATAGRLPRTGGYVSQAADYEIDLSLLGPGLDGATMSFTVQSIVGGLLLSNVKLHAGTAGLIAIWPQTTSCLGGTVSPSATDAFADVRLTLAAGQSATLGGGTVSLPGAQLGDRFSFSFAALLPGTGLLGLPVDNGGACPK
jgi:hypothetical protein